ncbi:MATE family efflux transporter [Paraclostridium sordellii]|uniref:MATE family efflux transporter n=1 Tax=Paraclostridium sordellii TaxID=1505 RepID=UPI0005E5FB52|nr:MATE family efflux transporter [Paeniclostridium sordellii]CEO09412.1 drug/sodium antiporter [[Clostridium] sordellii] [Paeniclostridium sordellii]CEP87535.1 drug/sodium antiporter [[Clostridium] sordellii] [Paeniclostridium sordellii]CEP95871.1 drug/sodium antiporter [[Clostridium] sordellii] [Paeniclostridium sordellii]CEP98785.1 drug/sodium antiporter [[Clostridium] sordellii] [Paeniclostridium sordellii]
MKNNIMLNEKISKLFFKFCIPAIISMIIAGMQTIIDGIFVGKILGSNAMASVNISIPFMQLIIGLSMVISVGAQSYIGLNLGDKKIEKAQNAFKTSTIVIFILGILITLIGILFNKEVALILGANDVLLKNSALYIKVLSIFTVPMSLMFLFGFSDRIIERPDLYFKGMVLSLFMNITLNCILVAKLSLGMIGTATATGLSYSSAFIIVVWPILDKKNTINLLEGKFDKSCICPILYNGSSEGINSVATAIGAYLFNRAFMNEAGEAGVAAFTSINYIAQFGISAMLGVSDGISPIISYNYGSQNNSRVYSILKLGYIVTLIIGIIIFIALFFFGEEIVMLFIQGNNNILNLASIGAKVYAFAFIMNGFNIVNSGYFTSIGNAMASVVVAASRGLVFIFIGMSILPKIFGINGVWMSVAFAELSTLFIVYYLIKKEQKQACLNIEKIKV